MKLLLLSPLPPPFGGIASWSLNLLNYYVNNNESRWEIFHQNTAIKYRNITNLSLKSRIYGGIRDTKNIISEFKNNLAVFQPDVIHLTSSASFALLKDLLIISLADNKNIPVVMHFRFGRIPELSEKKNWEWRLLCRIIKKSKKTIVIDGKSYNTLLRSGFENVVNIPNPISIELQEKAVKQIEINKVKKNDKIIFVGHVVKKKGVFELVKACTGLVEINDLTFIGPYENRVKDDLSAIAIGRDNGSWLKFMGNQDNNQTLKHLSDASLLVLPSYSEGFPNAIIEAMAMGIPVVATAVGAIPEMLCVNSGYPCGICVTPGSISELSAAINSLIRAPEKAETMGINGLKRVLKSYTISEVSKLYEMTWGDAITSII